MMMRSLRALRPVREFAVPYDGRMVACVLMALLHVAPHGVRLACTPLSMEAGAYAHTTPGCELSNSACRHAPVDEACRQARGLI